MATTDLTGISFQDQLWLSSFPLDRNLVFDYFALSPFYDRSCTNEQLRIRSVHPLDMAQLCKMTGIEYVLHEAQEPNLFIFHKQRRDSPDKVTLLSAYYILDGVVYQAPLFYNVVASRLLRTLHHLSNAFTEVSEKLDRVAADAEKAEDAKKPDEDAKPDSVDVKEAIRIEHLLARVLRKLPMAPPPPALTPPPGGVAEQQQQPEAASQEPQPQQQQQQATGGASSQQELAPKQPGASDQGPAMKKMKVEKR